MSAAFLIHGRFITDHARDRVFEYSWEDGLRFLSRSVPGLTYEQSVEILAGRMQFTGDSAAGLDFVTETDEAKAETAERYRHRFAGVFYDRSTKKHWRPYAYVTGWGADDMVRGRVENRYHPQPSKPYLLECAGGDMAAWGRFRCTHYMDDRVEDNLWAVNVPELCVVQVLWREVESPPLWWAQVTTPQLAVVEYVRDVGKLEERGAHKDHEREKSLGFEPEKPPRVEPMTAAERVELDKRRQEEFAALPTLDEPPRNLIKEMLAERGVSDEVADGLTRALTETVDYPEPKPTTELVTTRWAWVQGNGTIWPCRGYMDHVPLAHALVKHLGLDIDLYGNNADHALTSLNWVKIGTNAEGKPWAFAGKHLTGRQRDVVHGWLVAQGADDDTIGNWADRGDGFDY